jgi:hypothetical protein
MDRLIYNADTKEIITIIKNCEGTSTGTPFEMFEASPEEVESKIAELGLLAISESLDR